MDKEHKLIPQLYGLEDSSSKEQDTWPLCKGSEEVPDISGCGRYGSHRCGWVAVPVLPATLSQHKRRQWV